MRRHRLIELFARATSALCLLVMVTFLVGKALHAYHYHLHPTECAASEAHHDTERGCKICDFVLSPFVGVDQLVVEHFVVLITTITSLYALCNCQSNIICRNSRAPPVTNL